MKYLWCRLLGLIVEDGRAGERNLELAPSFPRLEAEPRRLEQVLCNLVSNSLKFIPEGGAALVGAACNPKEIEIWVKDTRIGISANENG